MKKGLLCGYQTWACVSILAPHAWFILTLCLQNIILVMLIVHNLYTGPQRIEQLYGNCIYLNLSTTSPHLLTRSYKTFGRLFLVQLIIIQYMFRHP